ncbi:unnamed protein product [Didymodactylos carnosus]|uniref:Uncharacterized protein n=1 Tax=Didymodactylos carnosus TaxID=1234261 RepID=A0A815MPF2_9BILA|nr:unnamed protein product [Didymodactylos carnosus]CAF1423393.1 unnamed protein product [Didymodactylos carnosus]CAF4077271.1 unnamed protein product [Didymodactylos carnosus]CAF4305266.1 unnamed protein product [Didymodactylos carnosus]
MNYLKCHKYHIFKKIKNSTVCVIPKWSKLAGEDSAPYEFRLLFSDSESLAKSRSIIGKELNMVGHCIYY